MAERTRGFDANFLNVFKTREKAFKRTQNAV